MKKLLFKSFLFSCLTVFPILFGKFFIPLNWYAFRSTEVLEDKREYLPDRGPYYPDHHLLRMEEGDIGRRTPYAVKKESEWFTDEFGYRNRSGARNKKFEVVLVGRSEIAGLSLTQDALLSETLERKLNTPVYSYSPKDFNFFLREERFKENKPSIVIYSIVERSFPDLLPLKDIVRVPQKLKTSETWLRLLPETWQIYLDQVGKKPILSKYVLKSLLYEPLVKPEMLNEERRMLFFPTAVYNSEMYESHPEILSCAVEAIKSYQEAVIERGGRFLFLPVPNKETIYWDWIPAAQRKNKPKPGTLTWVSQELKRRGVEVVDIEETLTLHREENNHLLYQLDDTHWNPEGVQLTAEALSKSIKKAP